MNFFMLAFCECEAVQSTLCRKTIVQKNWPAQAWWGQRHTLMHHTAWKCIGSAPLTIANNFLIIYCYNFKKYVKEVGSKLPNKNTKLIFFQSDCTHDIMLKNWKLVLARRGPHVPPSSKKWHSLIVCCLDLGYFGRCKCARGTTGLVMAGGSAGSQSHDQRRREKTVHAPLETGCGEFSILPMCNTALTRKLHDQCCIPWWRFL